MAVLDKDSFMKRIKDRIGEDTSDEALAFMEDMTDTFNDLETKSSNKDTEDWKAKYDALDKSWREKYKQRFFDGEPSNGNNDPIDDPKPTKTEEEQRAEEIEISDLFTEKE